MFSFLKKICGSFSFLTATDTTIQMAKRLILKTLKYILASVSQLQASGW